jgi:hypothetical protein
MEEGRKIGPTADADFFNELQAVFDKFPEAAQKYSVRSMAQEKDLNIDFEKQVGFSRIEDDRIVTEFGDRTAEEDLDPSGASDRFCCEWLHIGTRLKCVKICS